MFRCPLLAQSGHGLVHCTCPLLGVKQTWPFALRMSAYDPKRTSIGDQLRMSEPPIGRGLPQNQRRLRSGSELPNANLVTTITVGTRKCPYYSKLKKEGCHAPNSINSGCRHPSHPQRFSHSKGIFAKIGIAVGAGMIGGAMQDDLNRRQDKASKANNTKPSQSATESKHTKRTTKAKHQKPKKR